MTRFLQVDVFASAPFTGNPLAVFPDAGHLTGEQMLQIAREMNLSESTFVTRRDPSSYEMRIFTPGTELPFAGHPTLGTAWVLGRLGYLTTETVTQKTAAGVTTVSWSEDRVTFERQGSVQPELDEAACARIAEALGLDACDIGLSAPWLSRPIGPAFAEAGLTHLHVPLADADALGRAALSGPIPGLSDEGAYCFTALEPGRMRARGFFPGFGITEDPATGSAAAGLGILLADRLGSAQVEVEQGIEMGRPSLIQLAATLGSVTVGGRVAPIFAGELENLP